MSIRKHVIIYVILVIGIAGILIAYERLNKSIEPNRVMVHMVITGSYTHPATGVRITEVWIDSKELMYVCAQMLMVGSYENEKVETRNWIDVDCLSLKTEEPISYLTKESLFPKGQEPKYTPGIELLEKFLKDPEVKKFFKGFDEDI